MPTFFPIKASNGSLPMPVGTGRNFFWGNGSGPLYPGGGINVGRSLDYAQAAGDVTQNSAVSACLNWICTNWADAPLKVGSLAGNKFEPIEHHPLELLIDQPNEDYNGKWLMWALLSDYYATGNAYAHIVVTGGTPKAVEWLPAGCVSPVPDKSGRLLRYDYKPAQTVIPVAKEEVVHFRFGVSRTNTLLGVSPLGPVLVEIVADNACARYPANIMHHGGLPPGVFTLKAAAAGTNMAPLDPDTARAIMQAFNEKQQADPGSFKMIPGPLDFLMLGWKPSEMALNDLREEPETRICAQFGIPPIVVGLRAGMIRSTFANMEQSTKNAWTNCLVPTQKYFASEWTRQLLPFYTGAAGDTVAYDHSGVTVLLDDMNEKRAQARNDYETGLLTHDEARAEQGRDPLTDAERQAVTKPALSIQPPAQSAKQENSNHE